MTSLDWKVYEFLKEKSEKGEWIKMNDLAAQFGITARKLRYCITAIRENETIQKVLISDYKKGYKLMSQDDAFYYLEKDKIRSLKALKRYWLSVKRLALNNQMKLTFDTHERECIESLIQVK